MFCPKCKSDMEDIEFNSIQVERCTQCMGIWFTESEHKILKKMKGSEEIDIGSPEVGKAFDEIESVPCPVCEQEMERISDKFQPHIHYEVCPSHHGIFFDAGEYKDFKNESIGDFFKSLSMWIQRKK